MTIKTQNASTINNVNGIHTNGNSKPVLCKTTGTFYASLSDAAHSVKGSVGTMSCALKHRNGVYKGMKWCYVSDINAHLDDIATDIRANIAKAMAYDAWMARKEEIQKEQAILAEYNANIADINQQIKELQNKLEHELALACETELKIDTLKEKFWEFELYDREEECIFAREVKLDEDSVADKVSHAISDELKEEIILRTT